MLPYLPPPSNNLKTLVIAVLAAFTSIAYAADDQWDPEKDLTLTENSNHDGYLASNNPTGSTNAPSGDASGYRLVIAANNVTGSVAGAYSNDGLVSGNQLEVNSSSEIKKNGFSLGIYGARTDKGEAQGNTLIFSGAVNTNATIAGGYSKDGNANNNILDFKGEATNGSSSIYAGYSFGNGSAGGNSLTISGKITDSGASVGGGLARSVGTANENVVTLTETAQVHAGTLMGGYSYVNDALSNEVTVSEDAKFYGHTVYGGRSQASSSRSEGAVEKNKVVFSGEALGQSLTIYGGYADKGNAINNVVTITETAQTKTTGNDLNKYYGGYSHAASTSGNSITMSAIDEKGIVYGAMSYNGSSSVSSNNNTATLNGQAKVSEIYGGYSGYAATGNLVVVQDQATAHTVTGGYSGSNQAKNNTVELKDQATVTGMVYGSRNASSKAENSGTIKITGNTTAGNLAGFDKLELNVSEANDTESGQALLTLTGKSTDNSNSNELMLDGVDVTINPASGLDPSGSYTLIALNGSDQTISVDQQTTFTVTGTFLDQEWNVNGAASGEVTELTEDLLLADGNLLSGDTLVAGTEDKTVTANANSKTLAESFLGSIAFINQGAEFIADEGMAAMINSSKLGVLNTFGAIHGGSSNYKTGSRVDVDGYSLMAGASYKISPQWILGGFIEAGWADSDSHVAGTKGEGDHDYYGVGLATRYMVNEALYVDGSFRIGQASTEFKGLYAGDSAKYDSDSFYVTVHAGTGYVFNLTDTVNLDVYGRYLITYLDGDDVNLHNKFGDKLEMDSTVTHAARLGGRLTGTFCPYAGWKVGLAYEHVFDGDAESSVNSFNLDVPSLEGDTGIMEVGVTMKPSQNSRWAMDLGAKGYVGDREGVTGSVQVRYAF